MCAEASQALVKRLGERHGVRIQPGHVHGRAFIGEHTVAVLPLAGNTAAELLVDVTWGPNALEWDLPDGGALLTATFCTVLPRHWRVAHCPGGVLFVPTQEDGRPQHHG